MFFFGLKNPVWRTQQEKLGKLTFTEEYPLLPYSVENPQLDEFYLTTSGQAACIQMEDPDHFETLEINDLSSVKGFPSSIGQLSRQSRGRLAIINLGTCFGDTMHSLRALSLFAGKYPLLDFHIYQLSPSKTRCLTEPLPFIKGLHPLPCRISEFKQYDYYLDLSGLFAQEVTVPLIDFYLQAFGLDPEEVPDKEKRMSLPFAFHELSNFRRPTVMIHPESSTDIRNMPTGKAVSLVKDLVKDYYVVSAVPLPYSHSKLTYMSVTSFEKFCKIIASVDALITVDTCTYHIADAYNVPTVALFTSIPPKLRTCYYPTVTGIMLEEKSGRLYGKDKSLSEDDIEYSKKLWYKLSLREIKEKLAEVGF